MHERPNNNAIQANLTVRNKHNKGEIVSNYPDIFGGWVTDPAAAWIAFKYANVLTLTTNYPDQSDLPWINHSQDCDYDQ